MTSSWHWIAISALLFAIACMFVWAKQFFRGRLQWFEDFNFSWRGWSIRGGIRIRRDGDDPPGNDLEPTNISKGVSMADPIDASRQAKQKYEAVPSIRAVNTTGRRESEEQAGSTGSTTVPVNLVDEIVIPVVAEEVYIETQRVERSRVRIHKRVETREEAVETPSRREAIVIEHVPINTLIEEEVLPQIREEGDVLIIPIIEEVLVPQNRLLWRENVCVSKNRTKENFQQTIILRREVVDIDRISLDDDSSSASSTVAATGGSSGAEKAFANNITPVSAEVNLTDVTQATQVTEPLPSSPLQASSSGEEVVIPVIVEELNVTIRQVARAKVRVHKRVEVKEESVEAPVIHESVVVERIPVNEFIEDSIPQVSDEGDVLIIPVIEEILTLEKRFLLREEVRITKNRTMETHVQKVLLRREVVDVERIELKHSDSTGAVS